MKRKGKQIAANNKKQITKKTEGQIAFWQAENYLYSIFGLLEVDNNPNSTLQKRILSQYLTHSSSIITYFALFLFILFSLYQILYGIYNNILYSLWRLNYLNEQPLHDFQYFIVERIELDFTAQPHAILLLHSVFGGVFLMLCFLQTSLLTLTLTTPKYLSIHKLLGKICLFSSLISSLCACILSANAIHGTEMTYLLGTSSWVFFTVMTWLRIQQRDYFSHSLWANALQQIGVMFTTTRIIAPLCVYVGISKEDSYHFGVLGAGLLAHILFYAFELKKLQVLNQISSTVSTHQPPRQRSFSIVFFHRLYMLSLGLMAFVITPLLRFSSLFENSLITVDSLYKLEATMLLSIILLSIFHSKSQ